MTATDIYGRSEWTPTGIYGRSGCVARITVVSEATYGYLWLLLLEGNTVVLVGILVVLLILG